MPLRPLTLLLGALTLAPSAGCTLVKSQGGAPDATAASSATTPRAGTTPSTPAAPLPPGGNVVGVDGIAAWDALTDKGVVTSAPSLYLHQSVGQDLEDGTADAGYAFAYYGPDQAANSVQDGLNGGLFADVGPIDNGRPLSKMKVVRRELQKQRGKLKVLVFSFGYADVLDTVEDDGRTVALAEVLAEYKKLVDDVKAAGVRFVHVTPPLVFDPATNAPKMAMRDFMLATFKDDVVFDLTDIESLDRGARCAKDGVWHICQANRSTAACPSKGQGIDSDGQGHLCEAKASQFAKALLYAIRRAAS